MAGALMMERVVSRLLHYKNAGGWQAGLVQRRPRDHRVASSSMSANAATGRSSPLATGSRGSTFTGGVRVNF